jgi:hypothetical protein
MSQENVEVVRSVWDAWNRGDLEGILDGISPESEFHPSGRFMDTQQVYRGREEYVDFWREFRAAWEEITIGIEPSKPPGCGSSSPLLLCAKSRSVAFTRKQKRPDRGTNPAG